MIGILIQIVTLINALIFAVLTVLLASAAIRAPSKRLRNLALLSGAFVAVPTAATLLGIADVLLADAEADSVVRIPTLLTPGFMIVFGVVLAALGATAMVAIPRMVRTMAAQTVMLEVLSKRLDTEKLATLRLTPREVEVLEVMASGVLDDAELAAELSIAPSTAATHVRNIMRKAGVRDRRDLLLLRSG